MLCVDGSMPARDLDGGLGQVPGVWAQISLSHLGYIKRTQNNSQFFSRTQKKSLYKLLFMIAHRGRASTSRCSGSHTEEEPVPQSGTNTKDLRGDLIIQNPDSKAPNICSG